MLEQGHLREYYIHIATHLERASPPRTWNGHPIIHLPNSFMKATSPSATKLRGVQPASRSQVGAGPNELRQKLLDTLGWMRILKRRQAHP